MNNLIIRGLAAPFNERIKCGDQYERILPGAFAAMLKKRYPVAFKLNHNWDNEFSSTCDGSLKLFEGVDGLFFEASVPRSCLPRYLPVGVSVNFADWTCGYSNYKSSSGIREVVIARANISHIALVDHPAFQTMAWITNDLNLDALSQRLRSFVKRWDAARAYSHKVQTQAQPMKISTASSVVLDLARYALASAYRRPPAQGRFEKYLSRRMDAIMRIPEKLSPKERLKHLDRLLLQN
jgi:hypothetical protein